MAIVGNVVTEVGDVLEIRTDTPAIGVLTLTSFTDDTDNEGVDTYFDKKFRYSLDGITFSDWIELTTPNIADVSITSENILVLQFRYEKVGIDTPGLVFNSVTVDGTYTTLTDPYYFTNSVFKSYFGFNDIEMLGWYLNVTEKLYNSGLIGSYVERLNTSGSPEDFIVIWKSISKFFAYYVILARKFQQFYQNKDLLREFLTQRGLVTSVNNTLEELVTLMNTYNQQMFKRGTTNIYSLSETGLGELLRLIFFEDGDEFLFNLYNIENFGWSVGNCSPLYRGLQKEGNINKAYDGGDVLDLSNFPLLNLDYTIIGTEGAINTLEFDLDVSQTEVGIGYNVLDSDTYKTITIDDRLDYEISFWLKRSPDTNLTFGVNAFDKNDNVVQLKSSKVEVFTNLFVEDLNSFTSDYVFVRGILYSKYKNVSSTDIVGLNTGNNLRLTSGAVKIIPMIKVSKSISDSYTVKLHSLRVAPLLTPYDRGFVQTTRFITAFLNNKNTLLSQRELERYISRYLIPYNTNIDITYPGDFYIQTPEELLEL